MGSERKLLIAVDTKKFDVEDEGSAGGDDAADTMVTIGKARRNGEFSLAANAHADNALVPTFDDLAAAEAEFEGLVAIEGAIEFFTVGEGAGIVDGNFVVGLGLIAGTYL